MNTAIKPLTWTASWIATLILTTNPIQAQIIGNDFCEFLSPAPSNAFNCTNESGAWAPDAVGSNCQEGFEYDYGVCSGSSPCGGGSHCCMTCTPIESETIPWGDPCTPSPDLCEGDTTCRDGIGICLKAFENTPDGGSCKHDSECKPGTATDPFAALTCEANQCTAPTSDDCRDKPDRDSFCRELLGDSRAECAGGTGECRIPPPPPPPPDDEVSDPDPFNLCEQAGPLKSQCTACSSSAAGTQVKIWTAIGCIDVSGDSTIAQNLITWGTGLAGGIAVLLILFSAFQITTASSNPEKLKQGQEILFAAIAGLSLIIFSVLALNLIGVQILRIPGL